LKQREKTAFSRDSTSFLEESGQKQPHFRDTVRFISQVGNLNLRNWKITAPFRATADGKRKGTDTFACVEGTGREVLFKMNSLILPWRGTSSFFEGVSERSFQDLLRENLASMFMSFA
jgi:hypothetical protein